jgi:hypothetical protein
MSTAIDTKTAVECRLTCPDWCTDDSDEHLELRDVRAIWVDDDGFAGMTLMRTHAGPSFSRWITVNADEDVLTGRMYRYVQFTDARLPEGVDEMREVAAAALAAADWASQA